MSGEKFHEKSYKAHEQVFKVYDDKKKMIAWTREDTIDAWRHKRMRECLDPLLKFYPQGQWLTVGDGKYGTDARYIESHGGKALATDISDHYLKLAVDNKFISYYKIENAEALSFADDQFDFVLCKESFHHFPRPILALYEMLRVASKAVILIEPNENYLFDSRKIGFGSGCRLFIKALKNSIKKFLKRSGQPFGDYEVSGN